MPGTGALYRWELERAGREETVAVTGRLVCNDSAFMLRAARDGLGLAYLLEPEVAPFVERGDLSLVLEEYAPRVPGLFLYFPRGAERQPKLRAFIDTARRVLPGAKGRKLLRSANDARGYDLSIGSAGTCKAAARVLPADSNDESGIDVEGSGSIYVDLPST